MLDGMAKPMPMEPPEREKIAVLMPTTAPSMSTSAPPELPGLMAASVWMKKPESLMPRLVRATAETMPLVTVWPTAKGLPTASTRSPTSSSSESPNSKHREVAAAILQLQHGEVGALVAEQDLRLVFAPVGERHLHLGRAVHDVLVGDDDALRVDDDAGAERGARPLARRRRAERAAAEEALEEGIALEGRAHRDARRGVDVHHRRRDALDDGREGEADRLAAFRHDALHRRIRLRFSGMRQRHGEPRRERHGNRHDKAHMLPHPGSPSIPTHLRAFR